MNQPHLVYFVDPMCSWCYGFAPVIEAIRAEFGDRLPIRLILGGLRSGTTTPMDGAAKTRTRGHWDHVGEASGQVFDYAFFERDGFIYDTEPACRAVVLARQRSSDSALDMLDRLHRAFYAMNRDITDPAVLAAIAGEVGFDPAPFAAHFKDAELREETKRDFQISQETGVTGFPTVIAGSGRDNDYAMLTAGFQVKERIMPALARWLDQQTGSAQSGFAG
jgi:putative protein-disulfide isomerase